MPPIPGSRIGPYEIVAPLGVGGMGEVYRARDTRLDRDVALKILPEAFATDHDRRARFEREARTLAALNHPHIAQIYGFEQSGPTSALAMELVDGDDLSNRIARGAIPIDEALPIARQIAEALDGAHEQGIIHRDLKPANIKVRADGTVKVLDFGLAKLSAIGAGGGEGAVPLNSPTITSPAVTAAGLIVGTAAYMSPEQARGKPVDKRADIWAFGVILFEMLAGRRPLDGETMTDILGAIVKSEPDWRALPATTPASIVRLLRRTLEKDPRRRLADIRDARLELDDVQVASDPLTANTAVWRQSAAWIAAMMVLVSIAAIVAWVWIGTGMRAPTRESATWIAAMLALDAPDLSALTDRFAVAPDGSALVVVGPGGGLSLRRRTAVEATPIPGAPAGAFSPVFSPDGKWIAFATEGALMKIPTEGGTPAIITRGADYFINLTWGEDDRILFPTSSWDGIRSVASSGGTAESITFEPGVRVRRAESLPGGRMLVSLTAGSTMSIAVREADGTHRVIAEGWDARVTPTGHLLYARPEGATWSLVAAPFEKRSASLAGDPVVVARDISVHYAASAGATPGGDVFFVAGKARSDRRVVIRDRAGGERDIALPPAAWVGLAPSMDGQTLALARWEGARRTLWTVSLVTGALTKVTYAEDTFQPRWLPDGKRLLFAHFPLSSQGTATSIWSVSTDGGGQIEAIPAELEAYPMSVTSDGRTLYYRAYRANQAQSDIYAVDLDRPNAVPVPVLTTPSSEDWSIPSPNGHWLAYATDASGSEEARVAPRDDLGDAVQVSARGGRPVGWSPDSARLYYMDGDAIAVVDVNSSGPRLASRRVAFHLPRDRSGPPAVLPDGEHAVVIRGGSIYSDLVTIQGALTPR